jgi:hypothetical protein
MVIGNSLVDTPSKHDDPEFFRHETLSSNLTLSRKKPKA